MFKTLSDSIVKAGFTMPLPQRLKRSLPRQLMIPMQWCSPWLAFRLFPLPQGQVCLLCKDVLIWAFTLEMTRLLRKQETNWTFWAFLNDDAWGAFSMTHPSPHALSLPKWRAGEKGISCRQVTHGNFCSKPKSSLHKIWCFCEQFSWRIVLLSLHTWIILNGTFIGGEIDMVWVLC